MQHESNPHTSPDKKHAPVFIHSDLDEAGLTPSEFRIFCHVARRGECFAAVQSIAKICHVSKPTARAALRSLTAQSFLIREPRDGETTVHRVAPISKWNPYHKLAPLPKEGSGVIDNPTPTKRQQPHPYQNVVAKVTPIEVAPIKGSNPLEKLEGWKLNKDRERLQRQIREEKDRTKPDQEIIAGLRSELATINAEVRRRGKSGQPVTAADDAPSHPNNRNAGTLNEGKAAQYRGVGKINPRNVGVVGDLEENARKTVEVIKRRQAERDAEQPAPAAQPDKPKVLNIHEDLTAEQREAMTKQLREAINR